MAFSADGTMLAVGTDNAIQLWSVSARHSMATLIAPGGTSEVSSVAFSNDGRLLAALAPRTGIQLWDVATRRLDAEQELPSGEAEAVAPSVAFSANGALIAVTTFEGAQLLAITRHGPTGIPGAVQPRSSCPVQPAGASRSARAAACSQLAAEDPCNYGACPASSPEHQCGHR